MRQKLSELSHPKRIKELHLCQVSHKTYAITLKNVDGHLLRNLIQTVKQFGGRYSKLINKFEFQIKKYKEIMKEIKYLDKDIVIREVPGDLLRGLLSYNKTNSNNQTLKILPKNLWNRVLVGDPFLIKRYKYLKNFVSVKRKSEQPQTPKRVLLICWEVMLNCWITNFFQPNSFSFEVARYESITSEKSYLPKQVIHFQILTYEKVLDFGNWLAKKNFEKYSTLVCDDSQIWLQPQESRFKDPEGVRKVVKTLIAEKYPIQNDLLLLVSRYLIHKVELVLEIGGMLLPHKFEVNPNLQNYKHSKDLGWIKDRYGRNDKCWYELSYIFNSLCFINLLLQDPFQPKKQITSQQLQKEVILDNTVPIILGDSQIRKLKLLDKKFSKLDKEKAIGSFQKDRFGGGYMFMNATKLQEIKYIKQLRQLLSQQKLPLVNRYLYHIAKDLRLKTVVVVQSEYFQNKLEQILKENRISYLVYEIDYNELYESKQKTYAKFNLKRQVSVCLLVRDKLAKQYKIALNLRQKELQKQFEHQAEEELAIQQGGLREVAQYHQNEFDQFFNGKNKEDLPLKKINTVRHVLFLDVFWHEFSAQKEDIIYNIFDSRLPAFRKIDINLTGGLCRQQNINYKKRVEKVKHYFTVKGSYQNEIYEKYWINLEAHQDEREKPKKQGFQQIYQQKIKELFQKYSFRDKPRIEGLVDIDEAFDRLQFQVLKQQKQKKKEAQLKQKPVYNTNPPGLIIETPHLYEMESSGGQDDEDWQSDQEQKQKMVQLHQNVSNMQIPEQISLRKGRVQSNFKEESIDKYLIPKDKEYKMPLLDEIKKSKEKCIANKTQNSVHYMEKKQFQRQKSMKGLKQNRMKEQNRGRALWRPRQKNDKIICRKLKTLKVVLIPGKSSLEKTRSVGRYVEG